MSYNFVPENHELYNFECNHHVLIEKQFIKYIRGVEHDADEHIEAPSLKEWFPFVNSYYEFAEDFDAVNRVPHLLHERYSNADISVSSHEGLDEEVLASNDSLPTPETPKPADEYVERKAQVAYLLKKPKCFVILGKPGLGEERLGKLLADHWKCVFIHPETLILEEIRSGSRAGLCIEFNLRCGRAISIDVIIRLLEKRLNSEIVKHRGFVICGFPLIANDLMSDDPMSSESAIFNVQEIFEDLLESAVERVDSVKHVSRTSLVDPEEDFQFPEEDEAEKNDQFSVDRKGESRALIRASLDIGNVNQPICYQSRLYSNDTNQIDYVLSLCAEHDLLIIYLKCHNEEVVNIRQDNRVDCQTFQPLSTQRERSDDIFYTLYNVYPPMGDVPRDFSSDDEHALLNQKTIKLQRDFPGHVRFQLERYIFESQLVIEKHILLKNPEDIIKLDGRMSPHRLFQVLRMRLKVLPLCPVILPKLIIQQNVDFDEPGEGDSPKQREPDLNFDEYSLEDACDILSSRKTLGPLYKWNLSEWKFSCPVAMKEGFQDTGIAKYAVHFMNQIFFISNVSRCEAFLRNPRPYLLPPMPLTVRKVYIIGPRRCGKTAVANCIQKMIGAEIIDFYLTHARYIRKKMADALDAIRKDASRTAIENMKEMRRQAYFKMERDRLKKLAIYLECIRKSLEQLRDSLLKLASAYKQQSKTESESFTDAELTAEKLADFKFVLGIKTAADCDNYLNNEALIIEKLPEELQEPKVFKYDVIATDHEYVISFIDRALTKAENDFMNSTSTLADTAEFLNNVLAEHNNLLRKGKISGWIVDGFPTSLNLLELVAKNNYPEISYIITDTSGGKFLIDMASEGFSVKYDCLDKLLLKAGVSEMHHVPLTHMFTTPLTDESYEKLEPDIAEIGTYLNTRVPELEGFFKNKDMSFYEIDVADRSIETILMKLIEDFQLLHSLPARVVTDEEKDQEKANYGEQTEPGEEFGGEGQEDERDNEKYFRANRRLGNYADYDAVAFNMHYVLWKGKEDFLVNYMNKMWLFATQETMDIFLESPGKFSRHKMETKPPPPPRFCLVGNKKVGKTTQTQNLCHRLGLYYFNFETELMERLGEDDVNNVLENELDESILEELILPFWHDPNKKNIGFVLDGFPRRPSDVKFMIKNFVIPDCIIELFMETYQLNQRLLQILLNEWRTKLDVEKAVEQERYDAEMEEWRNETELEKARLLETRRQERYSAKQGEEEQSESGESLMSYLSYQEATDEKEVDAFIKEEYPEPVLYDNWETIENVTLRLETAIEEDTGTEPMHIAQIKALCAEEKIPWHVVNANMDELKVYNLLMQSIMPYKFRNNSLFERAYDVSIEMAEKLLEHGYYFLSRFGKTCPVQMYEKYNPLQMYITKEAAFQMFPMIYSNYIYFVAGSENREKFKEDILKYVLQYYKPLPLFRARIAIVGPPQCGKTTICERLKSEYTFEHTSIGCAARHVLNYMPSSVLAKKVRLLVEQGDEIPDDLAMQCIEAVSFEARAVAIGLVMDGFPNTFNEIKILAHMNLIPHLIVDLEASLSYIFEYMDVFDPVYKPQFNKKFIKYRYDDWAMDKEFYRGLVDKEYQNMANVSVSPSKWKTWYNVQELMLSVFNEIKHYYRYVGKDMVLRVTNLLVTPYEFLCNQSQFKSFCPLCLYHENMLTYAGNPPDRTGLMSYHGKFYWLCNEHANDFEDDPERYLGPNVLHSLPIDLPIQLSLTETPDNVFYDGYCIVCINNHKPDKVLNLGYLNLAIAYGGTTYLFDTAECMQQFFKKPHFFSNTTITFPSVSFPATDIQSLPTLGMLEQYVANQVVKALIELENVRPIIPGLTVTQSAVVCLGLLLKINNPNTPDKYIEFYKQSKKKTIGFHLALKEEIAKLKKTLNPFLHYEEPLPPFHLDLDILKKESTDSMYIRDIINEMLDRIEQEHDEYHEESLLARRVPVPDDRFDYLCQYHKPASKVPAFLNIVDIAGLVKGASEGQGLGNAFLSHISACDALFHLLRAFEDDDVTHVEGDVNPVRDLEIIGEELRLKDEESLNKKLESVERTVLRGSDKKSKPEFDTLVKIKGVLVDDKQHIRFHDWSVNEIEVLNKHLFLTSKPVIYLVNLSEKDYIKKKNKWLLKIKEWIDKNDPGAIIIPFSGAFEFKLLEMEDDGQRKKYLEDNNTTSALDKIIVQGYKALQLEYFFTAGPDEVKAWTIQKGTKAPQAAGRIHTDFEKGFIMAEVMKFLDFKEEGSETAAKAAGKYRQQGRNYTVDDGDIIFFKFNAGAGLKDAKKK